MKKYFEIFLECIDEILLPLVLVAFFGIPCLLLGLTITGCENESTEVEIAPNIYIKNAENYEIIVDTIYECNVWKIEYAKINKNISEISASISGYIGSLEDLRKNPMEANNEYKIEKIEHKIDSLQHKLDELAKKRQVYSESKMKDSKKIDHIEIKIIYYIENNTY